MNHKSKNNKRQNQVIGNVVETVKEVGNDFSDTVVSEVKRIPQDFVDQLIGLEKRVSGDLMAGESVNVEEALSGKISDKEKLNKKIAYERRVKKEEQDFTQRRVNELRMQLNALIEAAMDIVKESGEFAREAEIALMQAPVDPGEYHMAFFENMLSFMRSFRKKIENANLWLSAANTRAQKKNYWSSYKKHGAKFLLSGEHYLTRSAG